METTNALRHQLIESLLARHIEKVADAAIFLWEQMATEIISIIGVAGFDSLYARSVLLCQPKFPWLGLKVIPSNSSGNRRFAELKTNLEGQWPAQAVAANSLLLITFTDILATLIGEQLTTRILRAAWGNDLEKREELKNE